MRVHKLHHYGIDFLIHYFYHLFNKILETGHFPEQWSEGFVIPVHKKGDIEKAENYRGITLLSTLGKLFTRILNNRLNIWAEKYHVYIEAQAGFRKSMGTIDNIFIINSLITQILNENKKLYVAFIDFTKAFDFIVHDILWYKLIKIGVRGKILNIIRSMYKTVKSRVKYHNELSEEYSCRLGVAQGECLSPFLFSMYLNDLEETLFLRDLLGLILECLNFAYYCTQTIFVYYQKLNKTFRKA